MAGAVRLSLPEYTVHLSTAAARSNLAFGSGPSAPSRMILTLTE